MGNKEHLTFVFPLRFSHDGPKSSKTSNKHNKIPSLLSAHARIYILPPQNVNFRSEFLSDQIRSEFLSDLVPYGHPGELKPQHLSATTHLHNNHMYGAVNIGAFIKYDIGAFYIQLT